MVRNIKPTESKEETNLPKYQVETSRESPAISYQESRSYEEGSNNAAFGGAYPLDQASS
jgi:hypothetical protein